MLWGDTHWRHQAIGMLHASKPVSTLSALQCRESKLPSLFCPSIRVQVFREPAFTRAASKISAPAFVQATRGASHPSASHVAHRDLPQVSVWEEASCCKPLFCLNID